MQPIRLIAIDLDGTLLNSNKEISTYNLAVLRRAVADDPEFASEIPSSKGVL